MNEFGAAQVNCVSVSRRGAHRNADLLLSLSRDAGHGWAEDCRAQLVPFQASASDS
jgi:hypothetical protein